MTSYVVSTTQTRKTKKRPSPLFMVTMARTVNATWMLFVAAFCFFATPTLEWLMQWFLAQWVGEPLQQGFPARAQRYLFTGVGYAAMACTATPLYQPV